MSISPSTASVFLGGTQQFAATVSNTANTEVTWKVNGIAGGNSMVGTISASGLYTAPQVLPAQNPATIQATSRADNSKSATAQVGVTSDVTVSITPATPDVELGATRQFTASVAGSGNPSRAVNWSVAGSGCNGAACGTVDANGLFTAPQIRPLPSSVTLTAQSLADPAKLASAAIQVTSNFTLSIAGPTSANTGATVQFTATLVPAPNSNPSRVVSWSVSGSGCSGAACGTITGTGSYTAPAVAPSPNSILITATPAADPSRAASVTLTIQAGVSVQITPSSVQRAVNRRQTFTVQVTGTSNLQVQWQVNGIPGGDATFGRICQVNSNPCQAILITNGGSAEYLAPSVVPAQNPVTVTAVSQADPLESGSAQVTILAHVIVVVLPSSVTLPPRATQQFTATVFGTPDQTVFWQVSGAACSGPGSPCGTMDSTGFYTAPLAPPAPNTLNITAISADDISRSGSATVTISTGPNVAALLPASVTSGAAGGFTLKVVGSGFVPSSPGPGSTILFNGTAKSTTCLSASDCDTTLVAADLAVAGKIPVQIRNPNSSTSNQVDFVVLPPGTSADVIPLTPGAPGVSGKDIVVTQPSTAAASASGTDVNLNVVAIGLFSPVNNSCVLASGAVRVVRPSSGTAQAGICAFSFSGLDPSLTYTLSGPSPNDIHVVAAQPLGLGIARLTLQLTNSTHPGPRTLFAENLNKDRTAASGAVEVK